MIIVSNNLQGKMNLSVNAIIRINMAWIKTRKELEGIIKNTKKSVYLDFPKGRSKPPKPILTLEDAVYVMKKYNNIKYFAISNAESAKALSKLRKIVPTNIKIVPKIESKVGIKNVISVARAAQTDTIMFDKEDLYTDVNKNNKVFEQLIEKLRKTAKKGKINVLELQGVVFINKDLL